MRKDRSEDSDDYEWHECKEWPRVEVDFDTVVAEVQQWDGDSIYERVSQDGGRGDADGLPDISIFEPHALQSTQGGLTVPVEWTGVSIEAESGVAAICECFMCGEEGCVCEWSRAWKSVWSEVARRVGSTAGVRSLQRRTTRICMVLTAFSRSKAVKEKRRAEVQKKQRQQRIDREDRRMKLDWEDIVLLVKFEERRREWIARQRMIGLVHEAEAGNRGEKQAGNSQVEGSRKVTTPGDLLDLSKEELLEEVPAEFQTAFRHFTTTLDSDITEASLGYDN